MLPRRTRSAASCCGAIRPIIPLYAVNITLVEDGEAVAAAVGDGSSGAIYVAERRQGAYARGGNGLIPLRAGDANPIVWVDPSITRAGEWTPHIAAFVRSAMLADRWYVWMLGTSLALAFVAVGRISAFVHFIASPPLHTAAGCLLAREAGAIVTDFSGRPWTLECDAIIAAATPNLHRDLLRLVAEARTMPSV